MGLADAGRSEDQAADLALDEPQRPQLGEALGIEVGLEGDVELIEGLLSSTDVDAPGNGLDLTVTRYHNGLAEGQEGSAVGIRGTASLGRDVHLHKFADQSVGFFAGVGAALPFLDRTVNGGTATFASPPGLDATLQQDTATGRYTLWMHGFIEAFGADELQYTFDSDGKLSAVQDADGHVIALGYYSPGATEVPALRSITDTTGAVYSVQRTDSTDAYIRDIASPAGQHWHYEYDPVHTDYLTVETDSSGAQTQYTYDAASNLTQIDAPNGRTRFIYDSSRRVSAITRVTDLASNTGPTTTLVYQPPTAPCNVTSGDIGKTVVTRPEGTTTTYCYNAQLMVTYQSRNPADPCDPASGSLPPECQDPPDGTPVDAEADPDVDLDPSGGTGSSLSPLRRSFICGPKTAAARMRGAGQRSAAARSRGRSATCASSTRTPTPTSA